MKDARIINQHYYVMSVNLFIIIVTNVIQVYMNYPQESIIIEYQLIHFKILHIVKKQMKKVLKM